MRLSSLGRCAARFSVQSFPFCFGQTQLCFSKPKLKTSNYKLQTENSLPPTFASETNLTPLMAITPGQQAPAFTLFSSDKKEVLLADYQGKNVVLLFFPLAFTSVCTAELCDMRDNLHVYQSLNAEILAISVDSPFTLDKFKTEQNLPFPLLSDFNKEVSMAYGALYENFVFNMRGVSKRAAFVIDATGIIQYAEVLENAGNVPNFEAVKAALFQ
jgi:glutaredoxin-dependent peroxiredoxin